MIDLVNLQKAKLENQRERNRETSCTNREGDTALQMQMLANLLTSQQAMAQTMIEIRDALRNLRN